MATTVSKLPESVKVPLRRLRSLAGGILYHGEGRFCPICGNTSRRFLKFGVMSMARDDVLCPRCQSLERHRFFWLFVTRKTDLFDGKQKTVLHVAPELSLESRFMQMLGDNYLTADLFHPRAMVKMDITNIEYPAESFDVIYCSHVLEHVLDDKKAMREFHRTLKRDGWAVLNVPITAEQTFENPAITEPKERLLAFGQEDHVRRYGPDYADRLREAGFNVEVIEVNDLVNSNEVNLMRLTPMGGEIYYCTK
jgi:hypothetical protein